MDRSKAIIPKKQSKSGKAPPSDLIALGKQSKSSAEASTSKKSSIPGERKRPGEQSTILPVTSKKPKLSSQTLTPLGRSSEVERRASPAPVFNQYEEVAVEVEPLDLFDKIQSTEEAQENGKTTAYLCGAVKQLQASRSKPDPALFLTLMHLSKSKSSVFQADVVTEAFCSLLKRDVSVNFKSKGNPLVPVLVCNVLMAAYSEEENWPDIFVKVYIEDLLGERIWVDRKDCKEFVDNIQTAFNTKIPLDTCLLSMSDKTESSGPASPSFNLFEDEDSKSMEGDTDAKLTEAENDSATVFPRYLYEHDTIEEYVLDILKDHLNRRQGMDTTLRNVIRLMTSTCGYGEVRSLAAQKLEMWLQNPKLARASQNLLMSICMNCNQGGQNDMDVVLQLTKIRLKTKPLITHYLNCIKELLNQHQENLRIIMTHTLYNELSNARNPINMAIINVLFQQEKDHAPMILADIFHDLLSNKDDYLRALRALLREIVRTLRYDMNFPVFSLSLMKERDAEKFTKMELALKERYVMSVSDLISLCILLAISPTVREAATTVNRGDSKDLDVLWNFQQQVARIQRDAIWWLHSVVPKFIEVKAGDYVHCLHKVLFMESAEHYHNKDNWPPEQDRVMMLRLTSEIHVLEDTLMRILIIGLSKDLPLNAADAVELADQLVKRSASLYVEGRTVLKVENLKLINALLNLCAYRHPENISLPTGYQPPTLAISSLYWKAWCIMLIISSFNPTTFGLTAWENYPTLKSLMEMVMTSNYKYPPPTTATDEKVIEELKSLERQVTMKEKQEILEFESHLAAATNKITITENNSLLMTQLITMDPRGISRCPTPKVLDQIKVLNETLKIGQMLCRSRNPDFLLDIIQRQGTTQSMPWLAELVESNEGSLDILPVQCLCEFLLHPENELNKEAAVGSDDDAVRAEKHKKRQKIRKQEQLLAKLQTIVHSEVVESKCVFEVLDYFLKRLISSLASSRKLAIKGLSMVVSDSSKETPGELLSKLDKDYRMLDQSWLLECIPALAQFSHVKIQICTTLRQACQVETDPFLVSAYVIFLSKYAMDQNLQELDDLALDIAQLIVERTTVICYILPQETNNVNSSISDDALTAFIYLFYNYIKKAREPDKEAYSWSNTQDQIILQWDSGDSATMNVLVVHAMIILLTYGAPKECSVYGDLLDVWFPEDGHPPTAFLLDTSEEALLLPDWLKLRMIRSQVQRLVDAALQDLEPGQLLLFIQSFGIPVFSMSKLLQCLDNAVGVDASALEEAIVDKAYMAQLIEIQHMRGAEGGNKFYRMLGQGSPSKTNKADVEDVEMRSPTNAKQFSWLTSLQKASASSENLDSVKEEITQIFEGDPSGTQSEQYQNLIQKLSTGGDGYVTVIKAFNDLISCPEDGGFVNKLLQKSQLSCPIFRILLSKKIVAEKAVDELMERLSCYTKSKRSPLSNVVHQHMVSATKHKKKGLKIEIESIYDDLKRKENFMEEITDRKFESKLELLVKCSMMDDMKKSNSGEGTQKACTVLRNSSEGFNIPCTAASLFIDWLELLDPEVIQSSPGVQQMLIFAKQNVPCHEKCTRKSGSNQPYLLALLTHQTNWKSIQGCIDVLLENKNIHRFDSTAVLDFLWACYHIPRIWHGKERSSLSNAPVEDVLCLTEDQLLCLTKYIIEEAVAFQSTDADESLLSSTVNTLLGSRLDLLNLSIGDNSVKLKIVVDYLESKLNSNSEKQIVCHQFLLEIYLQEPYILGWLTNINALLNDKLKTQKGFSQFDIISHRLITTLGQTGPGGMKENKMYDANIACRKLAAEHPLLLLRQLPLLAATLGGKTQFTFGEFKHRNCLLLYTHVLGLLELLQPQIFRKEYNTLEQIIAAYFTLIEMHGKQNRQLTLLIVKFIRFLYQFVLFDPQRSANLLQKYSELLNALSYGYPDLSDLKSLLAALSVPKQDSTTDQQSVPLSTLPARPISPWSFAQLEPFKKKLRKSVCSDDVLEVLHDIDETSKRKVAILEHFIIELKSFMLDSNVICRNTAFTLILRLLNSHPQKSSEIVPSFLKCLDDANPDVINSALSNLAEFTVLCQDHATIILQKAFSVGLSSSVDTHSFVNETLQILNLETTSR